MPLDRLTKLDPLQLGRFRILARLGGGGMGNVYLAEADDGTPAALKVIKAELAQDTQFRARFRREVEAGRRVNNRCIARYLDADTYAASPWLATEFVPGPTLHHQVFAVGPVVGPRVVGLATGLADALVAIHAAGLVHRDLKPANVLLAPNAPKVIDFGISLAADATVLTTTGTLVGSPAYMSPEQAKGTKDVGPPADVFSWASCMTFAIRRLPPFGEGEAAGLLYKVVHEAPDLDGVPSGLLPFVQAALDKDPGNRPTAIELVAGLTAVLDGAPAAALLQPAAPGEPLRVVTETSVANAGRVLAVTWAPDHAAAEEAERTLAEAHELRASLPPRAEERQRRERHRANRAVFAAMFIALIALLAVAFIAIRPGQSDSAKALDNGQGPDTDLSTTTAGSAPDGSPTVDPAGSTTSPGYDPGQPAATGGDAPTAGGTGPEQPAAGPGGAATTLPGNATPSTVGPSPSSPVATAGTTCTSQVINPAPGGPADRLPKAVAYSMRFTVSSAHPASSLALVRQNPAPQQAPDAWARDVAAGPAGTVTVGTFLMQEGTGATSGQNPVVHKEPAGATFALQLRYGGRAVICGTFRGF